LPPGPAGDKTGAETGKAIVLVLAVRSRRDHVSLRRELVGTVGDARKVDALAKAEGLE